MQRRARRQKSAGGARERRISLEFGDQNFCARNNTETKTDPLTSSFWNRKRSKLTAIAGLNP
jgi:hypothetical protein